MVTCDRYLKWHVFIQILIWNIIKRSNYAACYFLLFFLLFLLVVSWLSFCLLAIKFCSSSNIGLVIIIIGTSPSTGGGATSPCFLVVLLTLPDADCLWGVEQRPLLVSSSEDSLFSSSLDDPSEPLLSSPVVSASSCTLAETAIKIKKKDYSHNLYNQIVNMNINVSPILLRDPSPFPTIFLDLAGAEFNLLVMEWRPPSMLPSACVAKEAAITKEENKIDGKLLVTFGSSQIILSPCLLIRLRFSAALLVEMRGVGCLAIERRRPLSLSSSFPSFDSKTLADAAGETHIQKTPINYKRTFQKHASSP